MYFYIVVVIILYFTVSAAIVWWYVCTVCVAGVRCKQGEFPDEWLDWLNENLMRGVEAGKIVGILASKVSVCAGVYTAFYYVG